MPTYSYRCTECGTAFDIHQAFTEDSLTECPTCAGLLRKVFSPVGVTFTGSGFYRNDSRAKESKPKGSSSSSADSSSSSGSGSSTASSSGSDSTPAAKPAAAASAPASSSSSSSSSGS